MVLPRDRARSAVNLDGGARRVRRRRDERVVGDMKVVAVDVNRAVVELRLPRTLLKDDVVPVERPRPTRLVR